jgi:acyl-CoA thioesterase I
MDRRGGPHHWLPPLLVATVVVATACGATSGEVGAAAVPSVSPSGPPITYVAIGASESVGFGADDPVTQGWTQVFYRTSLQRATTFVDLGIPGATVAQALDEEVPHAAELSPELVTVWLNANDLIDGVPEATYGTELSTLLRELRDAGARWILVANTPPLARLPRYQECAPYAPIPEGGCDTSRRLPPREVDRMVAAYNATIARTSASEGATVVDLYSAFATVPRAELTELVSSDGFHPSTEGYRLIGEAFGMALRRLAPTGFDMGP